MRSAPTRRIIVLAGRILQSFAAKGAAMTPPRMRPAIRGKFSSFRKKKKVRAWLRVTKNSAILTEPITIRGWCPRASRVEATTGPQPPPPTASRNPPVRARGMALAGSGEMEIGLWLER